LLLQDDIWTYTMLKMSLALGDTTIVFDESPQCVKLFYFLEDDIWAYTMLKICAGLPSMRTVIDESPQRAGCLA
jgi:hypothetical protein